MRILLRTLDALVALGAGWAMYYLTAFLTTLAAHGSDLIMLGMFFGGSLSIAVGCAVSSAALRLMQRMVLVQSIAARAPE